MTRGVGLAAQVSLYVSDLFSQKLSSWAVYHSLEHTTQTVAASRQIGRGSKLGKRDMEIVTLAAWFHDAGYVFTTDGHEERSVQIASEFLAEHGCAPDKIDQIAGCIMATKMPQRPMNLRERVVCDADLASLGKRTFFKQNDLLKYEIEQRERVSLDEITWLRRTYRFLFRHRFHTRYARTVLNRGRLANLTRLRGHLQRAQARSPALRRGRDRDGVT
ncbi:MAG: HD domain-containing protein [Bacteroidetes bacterium]|nr:HD domain-containing protein [Bacteroidota bacterium]